MIREKTFYQNFWILTLSIGLQNLLAYSVNLADNLMLGQFSQTALSGAALCNQLQFLLQMVIIGAGEGVVVLGTQYWGKKHTDPIVHIIGCAVRYGLVIGGALFLLALLFPAPLLDLLTNSKAVIAEGVSYLSIVCFSYLFFSMTHILVASLRSIGIVQIGYIISASTLCINIALNTCLIYGNFGFPVLGIRGAAIATLVSRIVELCIVLFYLRYKEHMLCLTPHKLLHIDQSYHVDYRKTTLPLLLSQAQWGLAQMVQTGILGHLGETAIAANAIAVTVFQVISVFAYGAASASGILVGKAIGQNKQSKLRQMVFTLQVLFVSIGFATGLAIWLVRTPILSLYQITPETKTLALQFMTILAITSMGTAYQMACDVGIIRGGGDTAFSAKLNLVSMWGIIVPGAYCAAFVLKTSPVLVFFLLKWDQIYKAIPVALRLHSWKWVRVITR